MVLNTNIPFLIWWHFNFLFITLVIFSCCMDTFLLLCVFHCGSTDCWYSGTCCSLFIQAYISASLLHSNYYSCDYLTRLYSLQDSSWYWRSSSLSWVLPVTILWSNTSSDPFLALFIMWKSAEAYGWLFLSEQDQISSLWIGISQNDFCWRLSQTRNMIMQNFALQTLIFLNNVLKEYLILFLCLEFPTRIL